VSFAAIFQKSNGNDSRASRTKAQNARGLNRCVTAISRGKDCSTPSSTPIMEGPGADSEEKHEPASDIDTVVVDSLKALDPNRPIREADMSGGPGSDSR
ncbi:MAG: hypothetical protein WAM72_03105, partial [Xanthobacteraceae bacterium]